MQAGVSLCRAEVTTLAIARIHQAFDATSSMTVEVEVSESYPQACAEAVAQVVRLFALACPDEVEGE